MKVILSRKGMDSKTGGMASPILPDGTLLSLPIPGKTSNQQYGSLFYNEQSFLEIINQLKPHFDFLQNQTCHLDPDIYQNIKGRQKEWKPAFGQSGIAAKHLDKLGVGIGDIFLFYGMFKKTQWRSNHKLSYVRGSPVQHIIYGYMEVGKVLWKEQDIKKQYPWHPHSINASRPYNRLYLPKTYGTFHYSKSLVLTKSGQSNRRLWSLPAFFAESGISISWQGKNRPVLNGDYAELNSTCRGQEFVITASTEKLEQNLCDWVDSLIQNGNYPLKSKEDKCMERIIKAVKKFAWNQMDAMWHDGSGLVTINMVKFEFKGYYVVNPWMDETTSKTVNPYKYYGKRRVDCFIKEAIEEILAYGSGDV